MSSSYPDHIFSKLTAKRQLQLLREQLLSVEEKINQGSDAVEKKLSQINRFLKLLNESGFPRNISLQPQQLERLSVAIERRLGVTVTDHQLHYQVGDREIPKEQEKLPVKIVLHNLRSAFNVGSIVRTAECLQVESVVMAGFTVSTDSEQLKKTDMGASESVLCESIEDVFSVIENDKTNGREVLAVETIAGSKSYDQWQMVRPVTLVFGNERFGLDESVIEACDDIISIPVYGKKNSLNVGVAASIIAFDLNRQWRGSCEY